MANGSTRFTEVCHSCCLAAAHLTQCYLAPESVTEPEILAILRPMIKRYALERLEGERFGDFVIRAGYISATTSGKEWYDRAGGEGEHRVETS